MGRTRIHNANNAMSFLRDVGASIDILLRELDDKNRTVSHLTYVFCHKMCESWMSKEDLSILFTKIFVPGKLVARYDISNCACLFYYEHDEKTVISISIEMWEEIKQLISQS